jgi:hypothetical protein
VFAQCNTEVCACEGITECKSALSDYLTCLAGLDGGSMESCASDFTIAAGANGSDAANTLTGCVSDKNCEATCQGMDAGPRK